MYRIDTNMPTSPYPSPFLRQNSYISTARPAMTTEHRYFGRVKTVNTTPASLTIIPDHRTTRADYVFAFGFSNIQLAEFLYSFTLEERRVSYVLRPGRIGEMLVQDVRVIKGVKVKVKEEAGSADGRREERIRKDSSVSTPDRAWGREGGQRADRVRCLRWRASWLRNMIILHLRRRLGGMRGENLYVGLIFSVVGRADD